MKSHVLQVKLGLMQGLTRAAFGVRHAWREGAVERKGDQLSEPEADSLRVDFGIELCDGWIPELECVPVVLDALRHARCWLPLAGLWDREAYSPGVAIHGLSLVSWEVGCSASFSVSAQSSSDMSPQSNGSLLLRTISREECGSPRMPQRYVTDDRMARRCATSTLSRKWPYQPGRPGTSSSRLRREQTRGFKSGLARRPASDSDTSTHRK